MADNEGVRQTGEAIIVSKTPDVCLTSGTPVPYQIIARFDSTVEHVTTVRMTGQPTITMASRITYVIGDEAGAEGGVCSGVNMGYCRPISHSSTVRANGSHIIYHTSEFWMNCAGPDGPGNTTGKVVYVESIAEVTIGPLGEPQGETNPTVEPETAEEEAWWETGLSWLHTGLDIVGLIPVLGEVADGINAGIHLVEAGAHALAGNEAKAAENLLMGTLSAAAMLPIGGQAATATKLGVKAGKEALEAGAEKLAKEAIEEGAEKLAKEAAEEGAEKLAKEAAEEGTEKLAKEATEEATEKTTKEGAEATAKEAPDGVKVTRQASPEATQIGNGHAYDKHVVNKQEFPEISTQEEFANHIDNAMDQARTQGDVRTLERGREAFWDEGSGTIVIRDPNHVDGGTAFRPPGGRAYFEGLN